MRRVVIGFILVGVVQPGCGSKNGGAPPPVAVVPEPPPAPSQLPPFPEGLKEPPAPAAEANGKDLAKLSAGELKGLAEQAASRKDFRAAAAAEYYAVKAGDGDLYDLACYSMRAKDADAGLYWLAQAGVKQGVDLAKVTTNPDFRPVYEEPRYQEKVFPFLAQCALYFAAHGSPHVTLVTPGPDDKSKPTPVIVWLHGRAAGPEEFTVQTASAVAKSTGFPVLGVSGTVPLGPTRYAWANDPAKDAQRVADALKTYADRLTIAPGKIVLVGYDEGAQVALELAARDGGPYAGAVAISPSAEVKLEGGAPPPAKSRFVLVMGSKETWNREVAKKDREFLTRAKAPLQDVEIPNGDHSLPKDLVVQLPQWVAFVLDGKK